ncbi:MAG: tRNA (adenosine(37)-N6)-threonylcarbamoyltransferase complex dimerization subunit type 1 TsaB [Thermodesulfobacteriota bacterium]
MRSLILDTSGDVAFLAVAEKGVLLSEKIILEGKHLSKFLLPSIQNILQAHTPDFIAIGIGPGSFTGTRLGGMVAKTLAFAWDIPLIAFSSTLLPDLPAIAFLTHEKYLSGEGSAQIELEYIPSTP